MVRYFAHTIEKTNKEKLTFAQKEVDEKTRELRKTFDTLREKEELLKGELSELEKYQELTVGRELKMIELKKTIKKLESQLTQKDEKNIG
jgi:molybdopterin converting factor small subunit